MIRIDIAVGYVGGHTCIEKQGFDQEPRESLDDFKQRINDYMDNMIDQLIDDEEK